MSGQVIIIEPQYINGIYVDPDGLPSVEVIVTPDPDNEIEVYIEPIAAPSVEFVIQTETEAMVYAAQAKQYRDEAKIYRDEAEASIVVSWEVDTPTSIRPIDGKTVDGQHISGEIFGGLFQP